MQETSQSKEKRQESATGLVTSAGGDKTCTVELSRVVEHPLYGKYIRRRTRLAVHDPKNEAGVGDRVFIVPCRPVSKRKSWRLVKVLEKANLA